MMIDGIDTFTAVTAILSPARRSATDCSRSVLVFRYHRHGAHGRDAAHRAPRVRSHSVRNAGGPAEMKCAEPESSASFIAEGPPMLLQLTVSVSPASAARFLDQVVLLHHHQRQEAEATRAERDVELRHLGARGQARRPAEPAAPPRHRQPRGRASRV